MEKANAALPDRPGVHSLSRKFRTHLEWDPAGKKEKILNLGITNMPFMAEEPSTSGPPPTIIIHPGNKESTDEKTTRAEVDIPPPVKAFNPETPPTPSTNRNWESLTGAGMLAVMASPFMFLFLALAPETERDTIALLAGGLFFFGLFCIVLGASKAERRKTSPKTVIIPEQPTEEKDASPHTAVMEVRSDNPWIDDGDDSHSFWASMLEEQPEPVAASANQIKKEIPVSSEANDWLVLYLVFFIPTALICIIIGGAEACGAVLICCMPELFFIALFGDQKTKSSVADVHNQGLNALLVVGLIALCLLIIIAFA